MKQLRRVYLLCTLLLIASASFAQHALKGANILNIGVGGGPYANYYGYYNEYYPNYANAPGITLTLDHVLQKDAGPGSLTVGGAVEWRAARYKYPNDHIARWNNYAFGLRMMYIPDLLNTETFNAYIGLHLGVGFVNVDDDYYALANGKPSPYKDNDVYPYAAFIIGARYNLSADLGVFAEIGADIVPARIGFGFKF